MNASDLQVGQKYRIKDTVTLKVCTGPMTYTGVETYQDKTYHGFFDASLRLGHWINPDEVEPAKAAK